MKVALTGATGFIGSHVLTELHKHGHEVTALVRDDAQADIVAARGATPTVVDLYDRAAVVSVLGDCGRGHPHRQSGDATSADLDSAVVDAAIDAFAGTGKPYIHISGAVDLRRNNLAISEETPSIARAGGMEGTDRASSARCDRHARSRDRVRRRVRRRRGRDSRDTSRLTPRRRRKPDHARHRATALVDSPRRRSGGLFPPRIRKRLGPRLLRHRQWSELDRRRTHRGRCRRSRRSRSGPRFRRRSSGTPGDYFAEVLLLDQGTPRPRPEPSSTGPRPIQDSSTSSATEVTATNGRMTRDSAIGDHAEGLESPGLIVPDVVRRAAQRHHRDHQAASRCTEYWQRDLQNVLTTGISLRTST